MNNLEDWDEVPGLFQFSNMLQLLNNLLCQIPKFHFFEKVNEERLKIVKCQVLKMATSRQIVIFKKIIKEPGTSFQSPAWSQKHVKNF